MITITYSDYVQNYNTNPENLIPEDKFEPCTAKAEAFLNALAMGRLAEAGDGDNVVRCVCEIAELYYKQGARQGIASENNDGFSVSYNGASAEKAAAGIAAVYLEQTGLLYRGIG